MTRTIPTLALVVLLGGAATIGCGGSSSDGSKTTTASSSDATTATGATTGAGGFGGAGGAGATSTTGAGGSMATGAGGSGGSSDLPGWKLVWSDEFDGADGSPADPTKWLHDVGGWGFGNQEREYYTDGTENVFQAGGDLHIVAKKLPADGGGYSCWYGPCWYTSGKLITKAWQQPSLFEKQFGRISVRMKIPKGQGLWPAFWLLGTDIADVNWPKCGEIDVMESIGKDPATVYGTLHGADANGTEQSAGGTTKLAMGALADDFHTYTIEWSAGQVRFLFDDQEYFTGTTQNFPGIWSFDKPYYLLLNLAVGGSWPGDPDDTTVFPAELLVDWVRVYDPA